MADIDELDKILGDLCVTLETDQPREVRNEAIKETKQAIQNYALDSRIELVEELLTPKHGTKVLEVDGDYLRRLLVDLKKQKEQEWDVKKGA